MTMRTLHKRELVTLEKARRRALKAAYKMTVECGASDPIVNHYRAKARALKESLEYTRNLIN